MKDIKLYLNQQGYRVNGNKFAFYLGSAKTFNLINTENEILYRGEISYSGKKDLSSNDEVGFINFSDFQEEGTYYLEIPDEKCLSNSFNINSKPYTYAKEALIKGLYLQRCGFDLDKKIAGKWFHEKCHTAKAYLYENPDVTIDISGGWHDAGDYGKYVVAGAVTVAMMLLSYEHAPSAFEDKFVVPNLLDEARYELEWMLKMQDSEGGLYHKVTTPSFPGFIMPEDDLDTWVATPVSTAATADFTACTAMASRIYSKYDSEFSKRLLAASLKGWQWLENNPKDKPFKNPVGVVTGEYGDDDLRDERLWAAAALYRATLDSKYSNFMQEFMLKHKDMDRVNFGWSKVGGFAAAEILFMENSNEALADLFKAAFIAEANRLKEIAFNDGYKVPMLPEDYLWGSTMVLSNRAALLILASKLVDDAAFEKIAENCLHWMLGANPVGISYITGVGTNSIMHPHHRPSVADKVDAPVPGLVSGGPDLGRSDPAAKELIPSHVPPAKAFIDNDESYATNEIAIYWNSPVIFLSGWFDK
ncbi:glycoside hydrolase family 9 protein [Clostridium sp. 19966]|uniref:glycoside hydrolase family 9 protein n=1 Tax=Clostridium sp. 19966 TaxID=2768166 RepID=UPI0028DE11C3|nr:glycoside hydrolase family 9 protein [Clostridium sp. 19966]MDT8715528.1 glycoside hydrolase family 9 protein [Clostridium sp. 19966]